VYIINDTMDRASDRLHPEKRFRPLAAGTVSVATAMVALALLLVGGLGGAVWLAWPRGFGAGLPHDGDFAAIAALYMAVNLAYSIKLKQVSIVDVMLVSSGYVLRVYAGAALIGVPASVWIIVCTGLVSLFIALAKRRDDLVKDLGGAHRAALKGYTKPFIDTAITIVLGGLLVSYLIYTTAGPDRLYLTTPFVIMGVLRYLQIALVEERSGSPTTIVLTDRFLILCMAGWVVTYGAIIYV
jgi:decaprenyl-phosphate phosphoribosyltransferase